MASNRIYVDYRKWALGGMTMLGDDGAGRGGGAHPAMSLLRFRSLMLRRIEFIYLTLIVQFRFVLYARATFFSVSLVPKSAV